MNAKRIETAFFISLILLSTFLLGYIIFPYLSAVVLAVVLAIFFHPIYAIILKRIPGWESASAFLTVIFSVIVILVPLSFFGYEIFQEAQNLYAKISMGSTGVFVDFLNSQLKILMPWLEVDFARYLQQALGAVVGSLGMVFSKVAATTITLFLSLFAFYYFLKDAGKLKKAVLSYSPLSADNSEKIIFKLLVMAGSVIKGSLVVAVAQGFLVGLGFMIFDLPNPFLWGSVSVIASLIPILGVGIVSIPGAISLFLTGNFPTAIGFIIWSVLIVGLADNFLRPLLIERDVNVHPLLIFFSVLGGLAVFGATGLILGPLALSLFLALLEIYPVILKDSKSA